MNVVMRILGGDNSPLGYPMTELSNDVSENYLTIAFGHLETHELSRTYSHPIPPPEGAQYGLCSGRGSPSIVLCHCRGDHHSKSRNIRNPSTVGMDESFYGKDTNRKQDLTISNTPIAKNRLPTNG